MAFQVSPGINISEIDLTTVVPSVPTTIGAIGGVFNWGPVGKFSLVDSENTLVARYGKPSSSNYETFFTSANFLAYSNRLYVSRAAVTTGTSLNFSSTSNGTPTIIISGNNSTGLTSGLGVFGPGIPDGTTITTVTPSAGDTVLVLSSAATTGNAVVSNTFTLNYFNTNYSFNAYANSGLAVDRANYIVKNADHFETISSFESDVEFIAKYPGDLGNSLKVSVCTTASQYSSTVDIVAEAAAVAAGTPGTASLSLSVNSPTANVVLANSGSYSVGNVNTAINNIKSKFIVGDIIEIGNNTIRKQQLKIASIGSIANTGGTYYFPITFEEPYKLSTDWTSGTIARTWEYASVVGEAPGISPYAETEGSAAVDELHVVVVDEDGKFSGVAGTVLEVYKSVSRATDAKNADGTSNYFKTAINDFSRYVWSVNDLPNSASALATAVVNSTATTPYTQSLGGGRSGLNESNMTIAAMASAYDLFADATTLDVSLILSGKARGTNGTQMANYIIDNVCETRKDCVVFVSPESSDVIGAVGSEAQNVVDFRNNLRATSYGVLDCGYKYQYDKYNDVYRWVPLNGDVAGLAARTDDVRDPWWSPAGFNRGQIKNIVKLAWNPSKAERDLLYTNYVNPVVNFPGQGTVLFGDKTLLGRPSAFDRINVRRLFIVLEKAIAIASNAMLFEFNDEFTRAQFRNLVEPFLRDVQGRRGIYDFRVVCDETNNTGEVIDRNEFVGDIYIKPAKAINFIQLNFVAVRTGVEFTEVVGKF